MINKKKKMLQDNNIYTKTTSIVGRYGKGFTASPAICTDAVFYFLGENLCPVPPDVTIRLPPEKCTKTKDCYQQRYKFTITVTAEPMDDDK